MGDGLPQPEMGTQVEKPQLAEVAPLPVHPTVRHPLTGEPIRAIGKTRNGRLIWPVMGGSQPLGGPVPGTVQQQVPQMNGGQVAVPLVPLLGGAPVPVFAPGTQVPAAQPGMQPQQVQQQGPVPVPVFGQQLGAQPGQVPAQQPYGQPAYGQPQTYAPGATPMPYMLPPGQPYVGPVATLGGTYTVSAQQPAGAQPGQQTGQTVPGQQNGAQPGQQGQQPQGGGQQTNDGTWDRPYPQGVPLDQMTDPQKVEFWKWHARQHENRLRSMGDYDQLRAQLTQLQAMTQTEWSRAVAEAEQRGRAAAMDQAASQMVAVAFQGAASSRMSPDQITAQLNVLDPKRFVHGGNVDVAAIQAYVDMIAPARQNGLVPILPGQQPYAGQLPLQQVQVGQPLQPGQPGYGQQPTFGPLNGQPQYGQVPGQVPQGQPGFGQVPAGYAVAGQVVPGQPAYGQPGYGQVPIPGVPMPYQQPALAPTPVVQAAGLAGLPGLPAATDFGQGPALPASPINAAQSGAVTAAARHGRTRSQQLAETRG